MRIRTIKPEFWQNEKLSSVTTEAMLLAIGLLNYADDEGYFNANPALIKAALFPLRECIKTEQMPLLESYRNIPELLLELEGTGYLVFFSDSENRKYGQITNFKKHQKINKPSASKIKPLLQFTERSRNTTEQLPVGKEQGTGNREQGKEQGKDLKIKKDFEIYLSDFSATYPIQVKMQQAKEAYHEILMNVVDPEKKHAEVMEGLKHYIQHKPTEQVFMHAINWLTENRWLDRYTQQTATQSEKNHQATEKKEILERITNGASPIDKIQAEFIKRHSYETYRAWLHQCEWQVTETELRIKTTNSIVLNEITTNFYESLKQCAKKYELELWILNPNKKAA